MELYLIIRGEFEPEHKARICDEHVLVSSPVTAQDYVLGNMINEDKSFKLQYENEDVNDPIIWVWINDDNEFIMVQSIQLLNTSAKQMKTEIVGGSGSR